MHFRHLFRISNKINDIQDYLRFVTEKRFLMKYEMGVFFEFCNIWLIIAENHFLRDFRKGKFSYLFFNFSNEGQSPLFDDLGWMTGLRFLYILNIAYAYSTNNSAFTPTFLSIIGYQWLFSLFHHCLVKISVLTTCTLFWLKNVRLVGFDKFGGFCTIIRVD